MANELIERVQDLASHGALKRDPHRAGGKSAHNQARFLVNAVIEASKDRIGHYTAQDILQAALFLSKGLK
jgi:hypothetical protein